MTEEYFIRSLDSEENRGPFNMDQLATLADAGKISAETLFYLEGEGTWRALKDIPGLHDRLFPKQDTIKLKLAQPKTQSVEPDVEDENTEEKEEEKGVSVNEVLDSAEGLTEETEYLKRREKEKQAAASLSMPTMGLSVLLFAFAIGWSHYDFLDGIIKEQDWLRLLTRPIVFLFAVDLILGLGLILSASEIFPVVRLRAMLGLGFFAFFFWSLQGYDYAWAVVAFGIGTTLCTLTLSLPAMIFGILCSLGGSGYLAFQAYFGDLELFLKF